jgi:threonine/homoserine/homoserine lactone efflux protein
MSGNFGLFLLATLLMSLSPGPNVLLLVSLGLRDGATAVLRASGGIAVASLLFLVVSALGLVALLVASAPVFHALCIVGAGYLAWLGLRMIWSARADTQVAAAGAEGGRRPFLQGFVTHIANPKAVLYWSALLPQFLDPRQPLASQVAVLGASGLVLDVAVLCGYGLAASAVRQGAPSAGLQRVLNLVGGLFFLVVGALLATTPRTS